MKCILDFGSLGHCSVNCDNLSLLPTCFYFYSFSNFLNVVVPKELDFTEFCLKSNPKSYGAWHHRHWLMKETSFSKVSSELKLLAKYLEYDDRNCTF